MKFFEEWFLTRLKELGWPKSEGILTRKQYITERAFVEMLQDVIRIALALGSRLPDSAKAVAITYIGVGESTSQDDVEGWIDALAMSGEEKVSALSDVRPKWLRFVALALQDKSGNVFHRVWSGSEDKFEMKEAFAGNLVKSGIALSLIAMGWALRYPEEAQAALCALSDEERARLLEDRALMLSMFGGAIGGADQAVSELSETNYQKWEQMAQTSVALFSQAQGLPDFNDRLTWI